MRLGGQLRVASGMTIRFLGWDMNAALALGAALGIDSMAIAVLLPDIEEVAMSKMNEQVEQVGNGEP